MKGAEAVWVGEGTTPTAVPVGWGDGVADAVFDGVDDTVGDGVRLFAHEIGVPRVGLIGSVFVFELKLQPARMSSITAIPPTVARRPPFITYHSRTYSSIGASWQVL